MYKSRLTASIIRQSPVLKQWQPKRVFSSGSRKYLLEAISRHDPARTAIVHSKSQKRFTYGQLLEDIASTRDRLEHLGGGQRVAFLSKNNYDYVVTLLGTIAADCTSIPLAPAFPPKELAYILNNSGAKILLSSAEYHDTAKASLEAESDTQLQTINKHEPREVGSHVKLKSPSSGGLMLYTSGTTSQPKGVELSHKVLAAQSNSLIEAWRYGSEDHFLNCLPLHHIHGTMNALIAPLMAGSSIEFLFPFNADAVWRRIAEPFTSGNQEKVTCFTAVPTIYNRLMSIWDDLPEETATGAREAISPSNLRLNMAGSAALPTPLKNAWTKASNGNVLLERYGMTEVGMALSCGLAMEDRVDGSVGWPLPSVEARLVDTETGKVIEIGEENINGREREGEIQLRGPTIFSEYWQNPKATESEFIESGGVKWFKTGDIAVRRNVQGAGRSDQEWAKGPMYFIRGRQSVDIIKSGGEKISALEIERELLALPIISEVAVFGLESDQWGQKVAAFVVLDPQEHEKFKKAHSKTKYWGALNLRKDLDGKLAKHKIPQLVRVVEELPRNAMGKVNKKQLIQKWTKDGVVTRKV